MANKLSYGKASGFVYEGGSLSGTKCHRVDAGDGSQQASGEVGIYPNILASGGDIWVYKAKPYPLDG